MSSTVLLDLSEHCIETAAKTAHRHLANELLEKDEGDVDTEEKLAILERFLKTTDFARIRSESPELAGGSQLLVRLSRSDCGEVTWWIER